MELEGPKEIVFIKPNERASSHIKPLYIEAHFDGIPLNRVLVDNGAAVNVLPQRTLEALGKSHRDLIGTNVTVSDFVGQVNNTRGMLAVDLTVGSKTAVSAFFVQRFARKGLDSLQLVHSFVSPPDASLLEGR